MAPATDRRLLDALDQRVLVTDGAMGTMGTATGERGDLVLDDFAGLGGSNEILDGTRPDVVRPVHRACVEAGADAVELPEELRLHPEQSTDVLVAHHPEAKYVDAG